MRLASQLIGIGAAATALAGPAAASLEHPGQAEFGLTPKQLVQAVERVESLIAECMREQGFEYVPVDYVTVRKGMSAIGSMPIFGEWGFVRRHGLGIATLYTGQPPQLVDGYSPGRVGLGERNVEIFRGLSPADQVAYNRALFGRNTDATFAIGLDTEDFSRCGGCTLEAISKVFEPDQLKVTYYNPKDALIDKDPRMQQALREYAHEMSKAGFDYDHPEQVEADIRARLDAILRGQTVPVEKLSPQQREALRELQDYERRVALVNQRLEGEILDGVESRVEDELFARQDR